MSFTPVTKVSAYEAIVEQIETAIESGELCPGDRLPGERGLMEEFSVSRATVREALRVLQATGVLESRPGDPRGPVISAFSPRLLQKSLSQLSRLGGSSRIELLQFRLFLDGSSSFLAAQNRSPEQLAVIEEEFERLRAGVEAGDLDRYPADVRSFHVAIREASQNRLLAACGSVISDIMSDVMTQRIASDVDPIALLCRGVADGGELVECLRHADPHGARSVQISAIYRFYESDLSAGERAALHGMV